MNSTPLYQQVKNDLQFKIDTGVWKSGDKLPPEKELEKAYKVSRITIRRAVNELADLGYLTRQRAKGTFVNDLTAVNSKASFTVVRSFTSEMKELGIKPCTMSADVSKIKADDKIARLLQVDINSDVLKLCRVRGADDKVITYGETIIPYNEKYSLESKDYYGSLYKYLSKFNIHVTDETEYVEAVSPTPELMKKLQLVIPEPLLKRVRQTSNVSGSYREYSVNYYIGSRYRYYVEF